MVYQLGVYFYRQYHNAGLPVEMDKPSLMAPKKVWDKNNLRYIDERELVAA
jgi:hypothetical protein